MKFAGHLRAAGAGVAALACVGILGACSSPVARFYTLGGGNQPGAVPVSTAASFYLEVAPVDMPPQVTKNQLVVEDGTSTVRVLEDQRWASLPGDEVRRALSTDLTQRLSAIDVYGTPHPDGADVYRVKVNVQQFVSAPGKHALIDAVWSVRGVGNQAVLTCRTLADQPVDAGYDALVAGHKRAVDQIAADVAAGIRTVSAVPAPPVTPVTPVASVATTTTANGKKVAKVTPPVMPASMPAPKLPCPVSSNSTASAQ
jgi:uncharacterized lipoprotein YmbA